MRLKTSRKFFRQVSLITLTVCSTLVMIVLLTQHAKCEFGKASFNYVGHMLSSEGLFPEPEKVGSILNMKPHSNTSEVRSFLGLVTYCGKFIPNFAIITEPLRRLTCQKADFVWNQEQESNFSKIKTFISKAPVLLYFHLAFETKDNADASKQGLGSVLL